VIRRLVLFMSVTGSLAVAGVAHAEPLTNQVGHLRHAVVRALGKRAPGRDIVHWGVLKRNRRTRRPTRAELIAYRDALSRMLTPSRTATPFSSRGSSSSSSGASASAAGDLPTCTWQPESGGDWKAVNPSSGAGGRYQILPSTWAAYGGTGLPQDASPAEQSAIAEKIMHSQGPSAWINC
jgi:hypothetical protein